MTEIAVDSAGLWRRRGRPGWWRIKEVSNGLVDKVALPRSAMANSPADVFENLVAGNVGTVQQFLDDVVEPDLFEFAVFAFG